MLLGVALIEPVTCPPPAETVTGQPIDFMKDRVLFRNVEGKNGRGYLACNAKGARFFIWDDKVNAIYLFKPGEK